MSRKVVVHSTAKRFVQVACAAVLIAASLTGLKKVSVWWHASPPEKAPLAPPLNSGASAAPESAVSLIVGRSSVIDGDTLEIHGERIRLVGIDAPESSQRCGRTGGEWPCGQQAALALSSFLGERILSCNSEGHDRYQRTLARCFVGNEDVQAWIVLNGWALAYRTYSDSYAGAEKIAQSRGAGIWRGEFIPPSEWRQANRRP